jgi:cytochrome b561
MQPRRLLPVSQRYGTTAQLLHWTTALLVVAAISRASAARRRTSIRPRMISTAGSMSWLA